MEYEWTSGWGANCNENVYALRSLRMFQGRHTPKRKIIDTRFRRIFIHTLRFWPKVILRQIHVECTYGDVALSPIWREKNPFAIYRVLRLNTDASTGREWRMVGQFTISNRHDNFRVRSPLFLVRTTFHLLSPSLGFCLTVLASSHTFLHSTAADKATLPRDVVADTPMLRCWDGLRRYDN
jgi:hypothetical protein